MAALLTATAAYTQSGDDSESKTPAARKHKTFGQRLLQPFRWIGRNWNAYDPSYSTPSLYDWTVQLQNTTTFEWVKQRTPQGMDLSMRSKTSHRMGPHLGYKFLFYGYTVDLNSLGEKNKRKNEFTLSINSNLVNIDLIRRRTGGDFIMRRFNYNSPEYGTINILNALEGIEFGDYVKNDLSGININYFTNHLKYSNPAAFSNRAVQLRSAGSPIVGIGYTRQKVETESADLFSTIGTGLMKSADMPVNDEEIERVSATTTTVDDWHLQLGYAYNLVFSRRLLLGVSAIISPSLKHVRSDNRSTLTYQMADILSDQTRRYDNPDSTPDDFRFEYDDTNFNLNTFLRASLTFNFNRWRAGVNASFSNYYYKNHGMKVSNGFGSITGYVGYCFGRNKKYRYNE
jgi:hypothetical protein